MFLTSSNTLHILRLVLDLFSLSQYTFDPFEHRFYMIFKKILSKDSHFFSINSCYSAKERIQFLREAALKLPKCSQRV